MSPGLSANAKMDSLPREQGEAASLELAKTLYKTAALVHHRIRCGKPACRCRRGETHGPYAFLIWRDTDGRQRRRYVRQSDVAAVLAVIAERHRADIAARHDRQLALAHLRELRRWLRNVEERHAW